MSQQDAQPTPKDTAAMPEKMELTSLNIADHQKQKLKELFPEVFTEGNKIDFDQLKRTLGEMVDGGKERFGMQWAGKADCFKTIQQPSLATLVPCPEESIDFDTTENVFIEGDNLEVLKLLQKSYLGKVKMIYIDPPYNTGKDFIYPDNYSENLDTYLEYTGQIDGEGRKFSTNVDTDGRFHGKWMNMMYPRLFLAKNLLKKEGIIFISIDDNEFKNLKALCDEIFGEENNIGVFVWKRRQTSDNRNQSNVSTDHEYILVYGKSNEAGFLGKSIDTSKYKNPDQDPRGDWASIDLSGLATASQRPNLHFDIVDPKTGFSYPPNPNRGWSKSRENIENMIKEGRILFPKDPSGRPREKKFLADLKTTLTGFSTCLDSEIVGYTTNGTREVTNLFGFKAFDFPKPVNLIKEFIKQTTLNDDVILDFFAGSGTTGQAMFEACLEDRKRRKFIFVQLPEPLDKESEGFNLGYKYISEISKERLKKSAEKIRGELGDLDGLNSDTFDLGFRVFKLQKSNFSVWDSSFTTDADQIAKQLDMHVDHISPKAEQQAILFELLIKAGLELTTPIDTLTLADKTVYSVQDKDKKTCICLEKQLTLEVMHAIADLEPSRVIVLDEGFQNNDQLKTNASLTLKSKGILDFRTV